MIKTVKLTCLCQLRQRIFGHNLEIENSGQYIYKIPRKYRICKLCHLLDNEDHSFFNCKINKTTWDNLFENCLPSHNIVSYPRTKSERNAKPLLHEYVENIGSLIKQSLLELWAKT